MRTSQNARTANSLCRETETPAFTCPACGYTVDRASHLSEDHSPTVGDLAVCARCGCIQVFTEGLVLRVAGESERAALPPDLRAQLRHLQNGIYQLHRGRIPPGA